MQTSQIEVWDAKHAQLEQSAHQQLHVDMEERGWGEAGLRFHNLRTLTKHRIARLSALHHLLKTRLGASKLRFYNFNDLSKPIVP